MCLALLLACAAPQCVMNKCKTKQLLWRVNKSLARGYLPGAASSSSCHAALVAGRHSRHRWGMCLALLLACAVPKCVMNKCKARESQ